LGALQAGPRTKRFKQDPGQCASSETQDNALQAGGRIDRLERELEGKLLPLSSFPSFFGSIAMKKATIATTITFFFFIILQQRRR